MKDQAQELFKFLNSKCFEDPNHPFHGTTDKFLVLYSICDNLHSTSERVKNIRFYLEEDEILRDWVNLDPHERIARFNELASQGK